MTAGPAGKLGHSRRLLAAGALGTAWRGGLLSTRVRGRDQLSCASAIAPAAWEFPTWSLREFESFWIRGLEF